jgi:hypothetical protein
MHNPEKHIRNRNENKRGDHAIRELTTHPNHPKQSLPKLKREVVSLMEM